MVSPNSSPPLALPMQVPQGHMVQQLLDPNGTLQHVIFTPDPMLSQHQQQQPPPPQQSHHGVPITPYVSNFFRKTYVINRDSTVVFQFKQGVGTSKFLA